MNIVYFLHYNEQERLYFAVEIESYKQTWDRLSQSKTKFWKHSPFLLKKITLLPQNTTIIPTFFNTEKVYIILKLTIL